MKTQAAKQTRLVASWEIDAKTQKTSNAWFGEILKKTNQATTGKTNEAIGFEGMRYLGLACGWGLPTRWQVWKVDVDKDLMTFDFFEGLVNSRTLPEGSSASANCVDERVLQLGATQLPNGKWLATIKHPARIRSVKEPTSKLLYFNEWLREYKISDTYSVNPDDFEAKNRFDFGAFANKLNELQEQGRLVAPFKISSWQRRPPFYYCELVEISD